MSVQKKICILGEFAVGKSSLVRRHVLDTFSADYQATLGVNIYKYRDEGVMAADGKPTPVDEVLWDIEGSLTLDDRVRAYLHGAAGAVIVGDGTRAETLTAMSEHVRVFHSVQVGRPVVLAINKMDIVADADQCDETKAELEEALDSPVFMTSAATGDTVKEMFHCLANRVLELGT
jgi:small GTP-binding protein